MSNSLRYKAHQIIKDKTITFELTARSGDGPYIPCMPAILLAKKLAAGELERAGAYPCIGFITKDEYLSALSDLDISWSERISYSTEFSPARFHAQ